MQKDGVMKKVIILTAVISILTGCQNMDIYSGEVYTADRAKQAQSVTYGTVTAIRTVKIQTNANSDGSSSTPLGSIGGAIIGGLLGNTVGGGKGSKLAAGAGAIAGAAVGSKIEDNSSSAQGVEIEIRQENGSIIAVVQKAAPNKFYVGQAVKLITSGKNVNVAPR